MADAEKLFVAVAIEAENDMATAIGKQQQAVLDITMETGRQYEAIEYIDGSLFGVHPITALSKALSAMADADVVAFLPGWDASKSCKVLRLCAEGYGKRVIVLKNA